MGLKLSIVGATGNVGREFLKILHGRKFPIDELFLLASFNSKGKKLKFGEEEIIVEDLNKFDFNKCDLVLSSAGAKIASQFVPKAAKSGCIVIDNSSYFRMDPSVPLIIPEVNPQDLRKIKKNIIANPNCSTIQMVMALNLSMIMQKLKELLFQPISLHLVLGDLQWMNYLNKQKVFLQIVRLKKNSLQNK